jgi:hypothetical protein
MSKPSLPFPLAAFEFLTNALVLVIIASVYEGQESVPSVEIGTASRGALGGILKRRGDGNGTRTAGALS